MTKVHTLTHTHTRDTGAFTGAASAIHKAFYYSHDTRAPGGAAAAAAAARAGGLIRTGRSDRLGGRRRSRRKLSIYVQKPVAAFVVAQFAPVKRMDVLAPAEGLPAPHHAVRARYSDFAICSCGGVSQICQWYRVCDAGALRAEPLATLLSCAVKIVFFSAPGMVDSLLVREGSVRVVFSSIPRPP